MNYVILAIHLLACFVVLIVSAFFISYTMDPEVSLQDRISPDYWSGGIIAIPIAIAFVITEWYAAIRENIAYLRALGILFLIVGFLALHCFLFLLCLTILLFSASASGHAEGHPTFALFIEAITTEFLAFGLPTAYFLPIGIYRIKLSKKLNLAKQEQVAGIKPLYDKVVWPGARRPKR